MKLYPPRPLVYLHIPPLILHLGSINVTNFLGISDFRYVQDSETIEDTEITEHYFFDLNFIKMSL